MANANYRDDEDTPPPDDQQNVVPADESQVPGPGDLPPGGQSSLDDLVYRPGITPVPALERGPYVPGQANFYRQNLQQPPSQPPPAPPTQVPPAARPPVPAAAPQQPPRPQPPPKPGPFGQPPFRPAPRQQYFPSLGHRPHNFWGRPSQFPMLPPLWQIPNIFQALAGQLGMWGSGSMTLPGSTQYLAGSLGGQSAAYMAGYAKGQALAAEIRYRQMRNTALELQIKTGRELTEYGDIFAEYQHGRDPQGFMEALRAKAQELHDQPMLQAIELGPDAVLDLQHYRDNKWQDLHKSNRSLAMNDRIKGAEDPWFHEGGATGTGTTAMPSAISDADGTTIGAPTPELPQEPADDPLVAKPDDETPAPDEPPSERPAAAAPKTEPQPQQAGIPDQQAPDAIGRKYPQVASADPTFVPQPTDTEAPTQVAQQEPPQDYDQFGRPIRGLRATAPSAAPEATPSTVQSQVLNDMMRRHPGANAQTRASINQMAEQYLFSGKLPAGIDKRTMPDVASAIEARKTEMQNQLNDVLNDKNLNGSTPEKKAELLRRVEGISPRLARAIKGYSDGTITPPHGAALSRAPYDWLLPLTNKYDPTITANNFLVRKSVLTSFGSGKDGQNLTSIGTAYTHLQQYKKDLQELANKSWASRLQISATGSWDLPDIPGLTLSPEDRALIGRLNNEKTTALNEYERALVGGKPTVAGRKEEEEQGGWRFTNPQTAISNVDSKITALEARMNKLHQRWTRFVGKDEKAMEKIFDDYSASGDVRDADELGVPANATSESNAAVKAAIRSGRLPGQSAAPPTATTPDTGLPEGWSIQQK